MGRKSYQGQEISVSFDMGRCIHARNCFLKLPAVFDPKQRPWVQPDAAAAEEVASVVRSCPSGALQFDAPYPKEAPPRINRFAVLENGPLAFHGEADIEGDGDVVRATLCRCGLSGTKPYCDGSHAGKFEATGEPKPNANDKELEAVGTATVTRAPDGPLKVTGPVELTTGTGRRIARGEALFLCRCGASNNKPFCDGSHKAAGFTDIPE